MLQTDPEGLRNAQRHQTVLITSYMAPNLEWKLQPQSVLATHITEYKKKQIHRQYGVKFIGLRRI